MAAMHLVGTGNRLPPHANVHETETAYVVELDVADFTAAELTVELTGPRVTVHGEQLAQGDDVAAFRLQERLDESFRLPDDVELAAVRAEYRHGSLLVRAPKAPLTPRTVPVETGRARAVNPDAAPI